MSTVDSIFSIVIFHICTSLFESTLMSYTHTYIYICYIYKKLKLHLLLHVATLCHNAVVYNAVYSACLLNAVCCFN